MSKRYELFKVKTEKFFIDCEFAEYIAKNNSLLRINSGGGFLIKRKSQYPNLSKVLNGKQRSDIANHLVQTIYSSFIKDLYEELYLYLKGILFEIAIFKHWDAERLIGDNNVDVKAQEIIKVSTYDDVVNIVIEKIFRSLEEERRTIKLLNKIKNKLGIIIPNSIVESAMPYLDLRHVLTHNDGYPDDFFMKKYQSVFNLPSNRKKLRLYHKTVNDAFEKITILVKTIDDDLMNRGLIK